MKQTIKHRIICVLLLGCTAVACIYDPHGDGLDRVALLEEAQQWYDRHLQKNMKTKIFLISFALLSIVWNKAVAQDRTMEYNGVVYNVQQINKSELKWIRRPFKWPPTRTNHQSFCVTPLPTFDGFFKAVFSEEKIDSLAAINGIIKIIFCYDVTNGQIIHCTFSLTLQISEDTVSMTTISLSEIYQLDNLFLGYKFDVSCNEKIPDDSNYDIISYGFNFARLKHMYSEAKK